MFNSCIQNYWKMPVKEFILSKFLRFSVCTLLKTTSSSTLFKDLEHKSDHFWWHSWWLITAQRTCLTEHVSVMPSKRRGWQRYFAYHINSLNLCTFNVDVYVDVELFPGSHHHSIEIYKTITNCANLVTRLFR